MGDGLAVVLVVGAGEGDDVAGLERGGINVAGEHQIAGLEVGGRHGVGQDDERAVAEQLPVGTVEGQHGDHGEDHHADGQHHQHGGEDTQDLSESFFHGMAPMSVI